MTVKTLYKYQEYRNSKRSKIIRSCVVLFLNMFTFHLLCTTNDPVFDNFCVTIPLCSFLMVSFLYSMYKVLLLFEPLDTTAEETNQ